jgi:tRNA splicing ligase
MKIETMNRENAKLIREILQQELTPILEAYGLEFEMGNISYDDDSAKINGFKVKTQGGKTQIQKDLDQELAWRENFQAVVTLDADIVHKIEGMQLMLIGFKPRARKRPYIASDINTGKNYDLTNEQVEKWFAKKEGSL